MKKTILIGFIIVSLSYSAGSFAVQPISGQQGSSCVDENTGEEVPCPTPSQ